MMNFLNSLNEILSFRESNKPSIGPANDLREIKI
jgi:hypothetical protein